jgi:hypothetical protein
MTLLELKRSVFAYAPELSDILDDDILERLFNECQKLLAYDSKYLETKEVGVVNGVFDIPQDCLILREISFDGFRLKPYQYQTLPKDDIVGKPMYYFLVGGKVYLIPKADGKAVIYYTPQPTDMVNDNDMPYYDGSDYVLIAYAVMNGYRMLGDFNSATLWERKYYENRQNWYLTDTSRNFRQQRVRNTLPWW